MSKCLTGLCGGVVQDLISIFNDSELELMVCGLPEIDTDDLRANTEYTGYTASSPVVQYFWEVSRRPAHARSPSCSLCHSRAAPAAQRSWAVMGQHTHALSRTKSPARTQHLLTVEAALHGL